MTAPMFALVVLTFVVMLVNLYWRISAVRKGKVRIKYFRTFQGEGTPEYIVAGGRHFSNLFEVPVLFYAACLTIMVLQKETALLAGLAWGYVACRCLHSLIHMTYNNILHRMLAFIASNIILFVMWVFVVQ